MFETVAPETFAPRSRKVLYETLPVSVGLHVAAVLGYIVATSWNVEFPLHTPPLIATYAVGMPAPPPPPPPPPAAATAKPVPTQQVAVAAVVPEEIVAPTVIPDTIPLLMPPATVEVPIDPTVEGVAGGVEGSVGGVVGGQIGGVDGGELGGETGGSTGGVIGLPANTVVIERDMPLPMSSLSKVYPQYPEEARMRGWEDAVTVRYIIARNGRVRDVIVLGKGERQMFTDATVKAIRHWRFRPLMKDGQAQEVIHELTVFFKLESAS